MSGRYRAGFPWGIAAFVVGVLAFIGLVALIVTNDERAYDQRCRERGGHVITVRSSTVCVDEDDRIILI